MRILLDTNIIAGLCEKSRRGSVVRAIKFHRDAGDELCLVPQIIYEFWVVATRPADQYAGLGFSPKDAVAKVDEALTLFTFVDEHPDTYRHWYTLVKKHNVCGKNAHDTRLVAIMHSCRLDAIMTVNKADFRRYNIRIIDPAGV